jgi:hypothetical protein
MGVAQIDKLPLPFGPVGRGFRFRDPARIANPFGIEVDRFFFALRGVGIFPRGAGALIAENAFFTEQNPFWETK